jgi:hypothetical protein
LESVPNGASEDPHGSALGYLGRGNEEDFVAVRSLSQAASCSRQISVSLWLVNQEFIG